MKQSYMLGAVFLLSAFTTFLYTANNLHKKIIMDQQRTTSIILPNLTFESIFQEKHTLPKNLSQDHIRILTATGDIIPARSVNFGVIRRNDPLWPYQKIEPVLQQYPSDILFINLESPLLKQCQPTEEGMVFCGTDRNILGLKYIGVTVANLANNHAGNYGETGVEQTATLLKANNITPTGINDPVYKNVKGIIFAFLGYNDITTPQPGITNVDTEKIKKEIGMAKKHADVVVVTYHWGTEYQSQPDERQVFLGHLTIDAGADLVIGNHPHWIQPIELYKGKVITYAHGNFIFDQMWSQKTREGVIGRYIFYDKKLVDIEYLPLQIDDYGQAHFLEGSRKTAILTDMKAQSSILEQSSSNK